jgi:hypothetical protein
MDLTLRPMSTSQVLDRTFQLYRSKFWLFAGIAALPPALILIAELLAIGGGLILARTFGSMTSIVALALGVVAIVVLYLIGSALATGATVHAVSRVHLASPASISESYKAVGPLLWRILGITLLISLMAGGAFLLGYLVLFVPTFLTGVLASGGARSVAPFLIFATGFIGFGAIVAAGVWAIRIYCRYSLAVPACVAERLPVIGSLHRSKFLSSRALFRIFLIYLLLVILSLALGAALSIPNYIEMAVNHGKESLPMQIWGFVASFLAGTLAGPAGTIAISLVYYDHRVRKEAFDLQLMMEAIGQPAPPRAAGAAPGLG